jgi:hypothetical protein
MNTAGLAVAAFGLGAGGFLGFDYATSARPVASLAYAHVASGLGFSGAAPGSGRIHPDVPSPAEARASFENVARAIGAPGATPVPMPGVPTPGEIRDRFEEVRRTLNSPPAAAAIATGVAMSYPPALRPVPRMVVPTVPRITVNIPPPRIHIPTVPQVRPVYIPRVVVRR